MKKTILLFYLFISFTGTFAQKKYVGLEGGLCFTNAKIGEWDTYGKEHRNRFTIGMNYELSLKNRISIGTGLLYAQKGFKEISPWVGNIGGMLVVLGDDYYSKLSYDYVSIPVKLGYSIGRKFILAPKCGIYASYMVKAQAILPETGFDSKPTGEYKSYDVIDQVSRFDFGGLLELEGGYTIKNLMLFSSIGYNHSLIPVTVADGHSFFYYKREIRHYVISLSLGVKFMLE